MGGTGMGSTDQPGTDESGAEYGAAQAFDWGERGTCPACRSGEVIHEVFGMPLFGAYESAPSWVHFAGCMPLFEGDRTCTACDAQWFSDDGDDDVDEVDEDDVLDIADL